MSKNYLNQVLFGVFTILLIGFSPTLTAQTYCSSGATNTSGLIVSSVSMTGESQNIFMANDSCKGYSDYTSQIVDVYPGQSYSLNYLMAKNGLCPGSSSYAFAKVFVDWNSDGDFDDANEFVHQSAYYGWSSTPITEVVSINVPTGTLQGAKRLRIVAEDTWSANNLTSCGTYFKGETEDYTITVLGVQNDAGLGAIVGPTFPSCSPDSAVFVEVFNAGSQSLSSVVVNWSLNGVLQGQFSQTLNLSLGQKDTVLVGQLPNGIVDGDLLKVWTSLPNNSLDSISLNDTLELELHNSLSGTYTIGSSGVYNFNSITEFLKVGEKFGVCGPVTVKLMDTVTVGNFDLKPFQGMSNVNTVTFTSSNGLAEASKVIYSPTASSENYIFRLYEASNFQFDGLTIENNTTLTYGRVFDIWGSDNIEITNCVIISPSISSSNSNGVRVYYSNQGVYIPSNDFKLSNSHVIGGSKGISVYLNTAATSSNIIISNNVIENSYSQGIEVQRVNNLQLVQNVILSNSSYSYATAVYLYQIKGGLISGNYVNGNANWPSRGLYLSGVQGDLSKNVKVNNNRVSLLASNVSYGVNAYDPMFAEFAHNSIYLKGGISSNALVVDNGLYNYLYNNIVVNDSVGVALKVNGNPIYKSNNNSLSASVGVVVDDNGTDYVLLSQWTAASGFDSNSLSVAIPFADVSSLTVCNDSLFAAGKSLTGIVTDFEGDLRGSVPCIGADEFKSLAQYQQIPDPVLCQGDSLTIELTYFDTVIWNGLDTAKTFQVTNSGNVMVEIIDQCFSITDTIIVAAQVPAVINNDVICEGGQTTFTTGINNGTYLWSTGDTSSQISLVSEQPLSVQVEDEFGCFSSDSIYVELINSVNLNGDKVFCEGSSVVLDANTPGVYLWSDASTGQTLAVNSPGQYSIQVLNKGCSSSDTIEVLEILNPVPSFVDSSDAFTVVFTNTSTNVDANSSYFWDFGDGNSSTDEHPIHLYDWTHEDSLTVTATLTVSNVCGDFVYQNQVRYGQAVSVNSLNLQESLYVFPNPSNGMFNIKGNVNSNLPAEVGVYTISGALVHKQIANPTNQTLNVSVNLIGQAPGVYLLRVTSLNDVSVYKITLN